MPSFYVGPEVFGFKLVKFLVSFVGLLQVEIPRRSSRIHPAKIQGIIHQAIYLITPALGAGEVFDLFYFADKDIVSDQW